MYDLRFESRLVGQSQITNRQSQIAPLPIKGAQRLIRVNLFWQSLTHRETKVPKIQFLIHDSAYTVGVATVDLKAGETARGLYMDTQNAIEIEMLDDIPLGHKIALKDHEVGEGVIKYEHDIGKVVADIKRAQHVHVHNLRTRRW